MSKNSYVNVRVDSDLKSNAEKIFEEIGISTSIAINLFLKQVVNRDGIPFKLERESNTITSRKLELANIINATGGKTMPKKFEKIVSLYANGDIDYDVAVYAIKKDFINEWSV